MAEPDILRTLALFGVIAQHILGAYARRDGIGLRSMAGISVCFELVRFAVPLFVFLFGMMLTHAGDRPIRPARYLGKRAWQILWPYLLWSLLYFLASGGKSNPRGFPRAQDGSVFTLR
jgi:surface polysaccharide O-acyltransferase-like enzyme